MIRKSPILLTAIFFLTALASAARGQSPDTVKRDCKSDKGLRICYNKFRDQTGVASKITPITGVMRAGLSHEVPALMGVFSFKGHKPAERINNVLFVVAMLQPERLLPRGTLTITSGTFSRDTQLIFLIDGERLEMPPGDKDSEWMYEGLGEAVQYPLTREQLEKLINAKKVEMEIGPREYKLNKGHLEGFTAILKEIERLEATK